MEAVRSWSDSPCYLIIYMNLPRVFAVRWDAVKRMRSRRLGRRWPFRLGRQYFSVYAGVLLVARAAERCEVNELSIVGAGIAGEAAAQIIAREEYCRELMLLDAQGELAQGKALDIW